jgi:hypothetical protein
MSKTATYALIESQVLASAISSITFSSIPATFTDLVIVMQAKCATADANISIQFNADTASNYSYTFLDGNGTSTFSSRVSNQTSGAIDNYGQIQQNFNSNDIINIFDYSNTTTYKTYLSRANNAGTGIDAIVGLWRKTPEAINSVKLICSGSRNFDIGSTFKLYGIQAGNA